MCEKHKKREFVRAYVLVPMVAKHTHVNADSHNYVSGLQGVADLLVSAFKEEQLRRSGTSFLHNPETDALSGRVREIARSALNMSEFELDEFFEETSTCQVVSSLVPSPSLCKRGFGCANAVVLKTSKAYTLSLYPMSHGDLYN